MKHERFESFLQSADDIRLVFLQKSFYAFRARRVRDDFRAVGNTLADTFEPDEGCLLDDGFV